MTRHSSVPETFVPKAALVSMSGRSPCTPLSVVIGGSGSTASDERRKDQIRGAHGHTLTDFQARSTLHSRNVRLCEQDLDRRRRLLISAPGLEQPWGFKVKTNPTLKELAKLLANAFSVKYRGLLYPGLQQPWAEISKLLRSSRRRKRAFYFCAQRAQPVRTPFVVLAGFVALALVKSTNSFCARGLAASVRLLPSRGTVCASTEYRRSPLRRKITIISFTVTLAAYAGFSPYQYHVGSGSLPYLRSRLSTGSFTGTCRSGTFAPAAISVSMISE